MHHHAHPRTRGLTLLATAGLALGLSACGTDDSAGAAGSGGSAAVSVVASTNVWGSVASSVGGDLVEVTSVISDPSQDPHSFEADTDTLLAVADADVVIENGGGYDDFIGTVVASSETDAVVVDAVEVSGKTAAEGEELNEHVWYDVASVQLVAREVAGELAAADPDHADDYAANADAFVARLDDLRATQRADAERIAARDAASGGARIAITEPVPLYLTEALGLDNVTPEAFSEAVEEGDDVSVSVLQDTLDVVADVDALVYNEQTSGPITEQVQAAAEDAGVPVVPVTETLPADTDYVTWMTATTDAVTAAVTGSTQP